MFRRPRRPHRLAAALLLAAAAAGCASSRPTVAEQREAFDSTATYTRAYAAASPAQACEAARRALLSQGYVIVSAGADAVQGRKHFQPGGDAHVEIDFRVVCAAEASGRAGSIAFVNALQDRYALKKSATSASIGVGVLGSVSLPFAASDDSLVRVASETITAALFYERFFALIERFLPAGAPAPAQAEPPAPGASASSSAAAPRGHPAPPPADPRATMRPA